MKGYTRGNLDPSLRVAMEVQLMKLQRDGLVRLTLDQLIDTIYGLRWRKEQPKSISACVNDICTISKDEIVIYLTQKAIIDGYSSKLSDFEDVIGGR